MVNGDLVLVAATVAFNFNLLPRKFYKELEMDKITFGVASLYNINNLITNRNLANMAVVIHRFRLVRVNINRGEGKSIIPSSGM
jgi:hypothetical protein